MDSNYRNHQIKLQKEIHNRPEVVAKHIIALSHQKHEDTSIERILESIIKSLNIPYETQKVILGVCIPDFFIQPNICIFADGGYWHNRPEVKAHDERTNKKLEEMGFEILRFWENDIINNPEIVSNTISKISYNITRVIPNP